MTERDITVLIVDDAPEALKNLRALLRALGYARVEVANSVKIAQGIVNQQNIDVVLCDMKMPGADGLAFLQGLRSDPRFAKLPFVMVSAQAAKQPVVAALKAGADAYVLKPASPEVIDAKIQSVLIPTSESTA